MSKYHAKPTIVDGIRFASKAEARRYSELKMLEKAGEIERLDLQPKFPLVVSGLRVGTYIADFRYYRVLNRNARTTITSQVVEDVKGVKTPVYRLKKKIVEALYPVTITEVA